MRKTLRRIILVGVLVAGSLGCTGSVGVGLSVGVPIGDHGYMSIGTSRWR